MSDLFYQQGISLFVNLIGWHSGIINIYLMNRLFGFFKEKLLEAKQENQNELQHILSAIDFEAYSEARMLNLLQQIKTNYLEWNIMIVNEASTGLYFTQAHHKTALLKHIRTRRDIQEKQERLSVTLTQMRKTLKELQAIEKLNYQWTNTMNDRVQALAQLQTTNRQPEKTEEQPMEVPHPQPEVQQQQIAQSKQQQMAQQKQQQATTHQTSKEQEQEQKAQPAQQHIAQVQHQETEEPSQSILQQKKEQSEVRVAEDELIL